MWTCPKCKRVFQRTGQQHSCATKPLSEHFKNKPEAFDLYEKLLSVIEEKIGKYKVISIPCCIHLLGKYDFIAILPKQKGKLEIRFALDRVLSDKIMINSVPVSAKHYKNCIEITEESDIDLKLIGWLNESYNLNTNK